MTTKAEKTTAYIIETVAPIFNKCGYIGTSMSDLTEATGLTKGAIYGNFENKEALALSAFEYNRNILISEIREKLTVSGSALEKIFSLVHFYRQYDVFTLPYGGCPILNVGVDAQHNNSQLAAAVKEGIFHLTYYPWRGVPHPLYCICPNKHNYTCLPFCRTILDLTL